MTYLMKAIAHKNEKVALFFLEKGIDVTPQDDEGNTALIYAISHKMYEVTKKILEIDPNLINIVSKRGSSPLTIVMHKYGARPTHKMFKLILSYCDNKKRKLLLKMAKGYKYNKAIKLIESTLIEK